MKGFFKRSNGKIDMILITTVIMNTMYFATFPAIWYQTYQAITSGLINLDNMVREISCIIFSLLWRNYADKLYKKYPKFLALEAVTSAITIAIVWLTRDLKVYFIVNLIGVALTTNNISCGGRLLRTKRYTTETERNNFEQSNSVMASTGVIVGSLIGMYMGNVISVEWLITIGLVTAMTDNVCYYFIYNAMEKEKEE